jgi:hypothetical protein
MFGPFFVVDQTSKLTFIITQKSTCPTQFFSCPNKLIKIITRNVCITKYARLYKLSNGIMVIQSNN